MEIQEIPEAQEPQKTHEPKTEEPQTEDPKRKVKNPIRVAAGKKGAEARWSKQNKYSKLSKHKPNTSQSEKQKSLRRSDLQQ